MLDPLFDNNSDLVAWVNPGRYIFDLNLEWTAYISSGNVWCSVTNGWLGVVDGRTCIDEYGCIVAWNPKDPIRSWKRHILRPLPPLPPLRPLRPLPPLPPLRPLRPLINHPWSHFTFNEWISGKRQRN